MHQDNGRDEFEARLAGRRLTPGQRRIVQCIADHKGQVGYMSSGELAKLARVSQPSVTRFAVALGFAGYLDMRRRLRAVPDSAVTTGQAIPNRYESAAAAEIANVSDLVASLSDTDLIQAFGAALAGSQPLPVLGLRAAAGLATQFCYFAAKVHPDVRCITEGGSMVEDLLEQAKRAGANTLLAFVMPLHPREAITALRHARQIGLRVSLVSDVTFTNDGNLADLLLRARINSSLVYDSYAAAAVLVSVLLDAMCDAMPEQSQVRLEENERSSKRRKVFYE